MNLFKTTMQKDFLVDKKLHKWNKIVIRRAGFSKISSRKSQNWNPFTIE
jgi:hypothetical protein